MDIFESVNKKLQEETISLLYVRKLFDGLINEYPIASTYLDKNVSIIHNKEFENLIVKMIDGDIDDLNHTEKKEWLLYLQ